MTFVKSQQSYRSDTTKGFVMHGSTKPDHAVLRDARGLNAHQKAFLFVVLSRGEMRTTAATACDDIGMGRSTFYRVRAELEAMELLLVEEQLKQPTKYRVNVPALLSLPSQTETVSQSGTVSHTGMVVSLSGTGVSRSDNQKGHKKPSPKKKTTRASKRKKLNTSDKPSKKRDKKASTPNSKKILHLVRKTEGSMFTRDIASSLGKASIELIDELRQMESLGMLNNVANKGAIERWKEAG